MGRTATPGSRLLALVVVVAAAGLGIGFVAAETAGGPAQTETTVVPVSNTTNLATPAGVPRRGYGRANLDVAGAVGVDTARLGGRHTRLTLRERLAAGGGSQQRLSVVRSALSETRNVSRALADRQAGLYRVYAAGELSTPTLLRRLARLEATATQQRRLIRQAEDAAERAAGLSVPVALQQRFRTVRAELALLPSPLADRLVAAVSGATAAETVYVEGTPEGVVFAGIVDGTYHREATLLAQRRPGGTTRFADIGAAQTRYSELYPWLFDESSGGRTVRQLGNTPVYVLEADHTQGSLGIADIQSYVDGATGMPFYERQSKDPEAVPVTSVNSATTDGLTVRVTATHETGPLGVTVSNDTGAVSGATVRIGGQTVGRTDADGRLWTVQPRGRFTVTVDRAGDNVAVTGP